MGNSEVISDEVKEAAFRFYRQGVMDSFGSYLPEEYILQLEEMILRLVEGGVPNEDEWVMVVELERLRGEE